MPDPRPTWELVLEIARGLLAQGRTPFRRGDIVEGVQRFEDGPGFSYIRLMTTQRPHEVRPIISGRIELLRSGMESTLTNAERLLVTADDR